MQSVGSITSGTTADGRDYVPGINCMDCGRFVGRDGYLGIETFEMSTTVASVEGQCARCGQAEAERYAEQAGQR